MKRVIANKWKECFDSTMQDDSDSADDFEEPRPNTSQRRRRSSHRPERANTDDVMTSSQGLYCKICEKHFENHEQLINHLYKHAPNPAQDVSETGEASVEEDNEEENDEDEDGEEANFKCKLCDSKFSDTEKGKIHLKECHGDVFGLKNKASRNSSSNGADKNCYSNDIEDLPKVSLKSPRKGPGSAKSPDSVWYICSICLEVFPTTHFANIHRYQEHSEAHFKKKRIFTKIIIPKSGVKLLQRHHALPKERIGASDLLHDKYLTKDTTNKFKSPTRSAKQSTIPEFEEESAEERLSKTINPYKYIEYIDKRNKHKENRKRNSSDIEAATIKLRKTIPADAEEPATLYLCLKCKLHFDNTHKLQHHYTKCNKLDSNECTKCGLKFSLKELTQHTIRHHSSDEQKHFKVIQVKSPNENGKKEKLYKCSLCDDHFMRIPAVFSHFYRREGRAHPTTGTLCTICQFVFPKKTLQQHVKIHHEERHLQREDFVVKVIHSKFNSNDDKDSANRHKDGNNESEHENSDTTPRNKSDESEGGYSCIDSSDDFASDCDDDWDLNHINKELPPVMRKKPHTKTISDLSPTKARSKTVHRKCLTCNEMVANFKDQGNCETCAKKNQETRSTRSNPIEPQQQPSTSTSERNADGNNKQLLFKYSIRQRDHKTLKLKECDIHFDSYRALQYHMSRELCDSEVKGLCITCDKYFAAGYQLTRHVNISHKQHELSYSDFKVVTESDLLNLEAGDAQPRERSSAKNAHLATNSPKGDNDRPQDPRKNKTENQAETSVSARNNTKSKERVDKEKENKQPKLNVRNNSPKKHSEINVELRKSDVNSSCPPQSTPKTQETSVKKQSSNKSVEKQNKTPTPYKGKDQKRIPSEIADSHNKPKASTSNTKTNEKNKPTTTNKISRKAKDKETSTNTKDNSTKNSAESKDHPNNASTQDTGILDSILKLMGPKTPAKSVTDSNSTKPNVVVTDIRIINPFKPRDVTSDVLGNTAANTMRLETSQVAISNQNVQTHTDAFNVTPTMSAARDPRQSNFASFSHDYNHVSSYTDPCTASNSTLLNQEYTDIDSSSNMRNASNTNKPLDTQHQNSYSNFSSNCNNDTKYGSSVKPNRIVTRRKTTDWRPSENISLSINNQNPKPQRIAHRSRSLSGRHGEDSLERSRNDRDRRDNYSTKHNTRYSSGSNSSLDRSRSNHRSKSRSGSPKSTGLPYKVYKPQYHPNSYKDRYSRENYGNRYFSRPSSDKRYTQTGYNHRHYYDKYGNGRNERDEMLEHSDTSNRSARYEDQIRHNYESNKKKMEFFKCSKCRVYFVTKRECLGHINDHIISFNVNTKANYIECSICYLNIDILAIDFHRKTHHDDIIYDQRYVSVTEYSLDRNDLPVNDNYTMDLEHKTEVTNEINERKRKKRTEQSEVKKKRKTSSNNREGTEVQNRTQQNESTTDNDLKTGDTISKNNITISSERLLKPVVDEAKQNSLDFQSKVNQLDKNTRDNTSNKISRDSTTFNLDQSTDSSSNTNTIVSASILGLEKVRIESVRTLPKEIGYNEDNQTSIENQNMSRESGERLNTEENIETDDTNQEVLDRRNDTPSEVTIRNKENCITQPNVFDNTNNAESILKPHSGQDRVTTGENYVNSSCNASESFEPTTLVNSKLNSVDSNSPITYDVILDGGIEDEFATPPIVEDKPVNTRDEIKTIEPPNLEDEDTLLLGFGDSILDSETGDVMIKSKDEDTANQSTDDINIIQNPLSKVNVPINTRVDIELKTSEETQTITVINLNTDDKDTNNETLSQASSQEETVPNIEKFLRKLQLLKQTGNNQNKIRPIVDMDSSTKSGREQQDDNSKEVHNNSSNNIVQRSTVETLTKMDPIVSQNDQELYFRTVNDHQLFGITVLITNTDHGNTVNNQASAPRCVEDNLALTSIEETSTCSKATEIRFSVEENGEINKCNEPQDNNIGGTCKGSVTPVLDIIQEYLDGVINSKSVNTNESSHKIGAEVINTENSTLPSCDINTDHRLVQDVPNVSDTHISAVAQNILSSEKSLHLVIDKLTKKFEDTNKVIEESPNDRFNAEHECDSGTDSDNTQDYEYDKSWLGPINSKITHNSLELDGNTTPNTVGDDNLANNEHNTRITEINDGETKISDNEENITDNIDINNDADESDDDVIFVERKEVIYQISDGESDTEESSLPKEEKYLNYTCPDIKVKKTGVKQSDIRKFMAMKKEKTESNQTSTANGKNETISANINENPSTSVIVSIGEVVATVKKAVSVIDEVVAISDDEDEVETRIVKTEPFVNKQLTVTGYIEID